MVSKPGHNQTKPPLKLVNNTTYDNMNQFDQHVFNHECQNFTRDLISPERGTLCK